MNKAELRGRDQEVSRASETTVSSGIIIPPPDKRTRGLRPQARKLRRNMRLEGTGEREEEGE